VLLGRIDRTATTPVYRQLVDAIRAMIAASDLVPGDALPSTRRLAEALGLNRSTVYRAYQELWALGYLESRSGSYTTVRSRADLAAEPPERASGLIAWDERAAPRCRVLFAEYDRMRQRRATVRATCVDFATLAPDERLLPVPEFRSCMQQVLARNGRNLLQYGDTLGYKPLRESIAQRMRHHGVAVGPDEILVTNGSQNALEVVLQFLVTPGAPVVVGSPTYGAVLSLLAFHRAEVVPVAVGGTGLDLDALAAVLAVRRPAFVYTIPNFHNPTGVTTPQAHRERLLALCREREVPIVEDGFEEEMKYFGQAVLPIKSMDVDGLVLYLGTFSKVLFPGLRIGWVAADRAAVQRLAALKWAGDLGGTHVTQAALDLFCRRDLYEIHLKRLHREYRKRMQTALRAMDAELDTSVATWTRPQGGYTIWLGLTGCTVTEDELVAHLARCGVLVTPGSESFLDPAEDVVHLRLSIARTDVDEIVEGMGRLGRVVTEVVTVKRRKGRQGGSSCRASA